MSPSDSLRTVAIGSESCVLGFGQLGIAGRVARTTADVEAALTALLADSTVGIVLIAADAAALARKRVDQLKVNSMHPLVVEIPGENGWPMRSLKDFVQSAVGISLGNAR